MKIPGMTLNKKHKDAILFALLAEASQKHKDPIIKASRAIKQLWKEQFILSAEIAYPFLDKQHWGELLRTHAANSCTGVGEVYTLDVKKTPKEKPSFSGRKLGYTVIRCETKEEREGYSMVEDVIESKWTGLAFDLNGPDPASQYTDTLVVHMPTYFADVLRSPLTHIQIGKLEAGLLTDKAEIEWVTRARPLAIRTQELSLKLKKITIEMFDYYVLLSKVLAGIRTLAQLERQFPEAVQYCPERPAPANQLVATEQLAEARAILAKGIPNE